MADGWDDIYEPQRDMREIRLPENAKLDERIVRLLSEKMKADGESKMFITIDATGEVRKGANRYEAARRIGLKAMPCIIETKGDIRDGNQG
jgi:hypothetical protein